MKNRQLPQLFAQALNEHNIDRFDEFIHPEYRNHNRFVEPGREGVKAFFIRWLEAFPDSQVRIEEVLEDGDRISARISYTGTFTRPFWGYRQNGAAIEMHSIDIWRVQNGKFVEHWDEVNALDVFQAMGAATVHRPE
jgi:predicted SnoaL-like aldol condensation-catalyzing enzyme